MILFIVEIVVIALLLCILATLVINERRAKGRAKPRARVDAYWQGAERRKFFRFRRTLDAVYRIEKKPHIRTYCRTADISEGGLRLVLDAKLSPGEIVDLLMEIPGTDRETEAEGKVVWCNESPDQDDPAGKRLFHIGIQFCRITGRSAKVLGDYIKSISA